MAEQLEKLDPNDVAGQAGDFMGTIQGLTGAAGGMSALSVANVPGVGNPTSAVKKKLKSEARKAIIVPAGELINEFMQQICTGGIKEEDIPEINKKIRKLNALLDKIGSAINGLESFANTIFPVIIIITVIYIVAKVISFIPVIGSGYIGIISFPIPQNIALALMAICGTILEILKVVVFAIIAVMLMLVAILRFLKMALAFLMMTMAQQTELQDQAIADTLKTADDWGAGDGDNIGDDSSLFEDGTLNSNQLNDDGTSEERLELMLQINDLDYQINQISDLGENLITCVLPDGSVEQLTPTACAAAGGINEADLITCILPDGSVQELTPAACNAAGGTYPGPPTGPPPPDSPFCNSDGICWMWVDPPGMWMVIPPDCSPPECSSPFCYPNGVCCEWLDPPGEWQCPMAPQGPPPPDSPYTDGLGYTWCWNEQTGEWKLCDGSDFTSFPDGSNADSSSGAGMGFCTLPNGEVEEMTAAECAAAGGIFGFGLISCTLPNGVTQQLTPEACLLAGGSYGGMVACLLPDGTIQNMTPEDCLTAGGRFGDDLINLRGDLEHSLNNLGGPLTDGIDDLRITSLLNLHKDITVRKVIKNKGKRYGFYQRVIKNK